MKQRKTKARGLMRGLPDPDRRMLAERRSSSRAGLSRGFAAVHGEHEARREAAAFALVELQASTVCSRDAFHDRQAQARSAAAAACRFKAREGQLHALAFG